MSIYTVLPSGRNREKSLTLAFILALVIHALLIVGINFSILSSPSQDPAVSLNITLMEIHGGNPAPASKSTAAIERTLPGSASVKPPVKTPKPPSAARVAVPVSKSVPLPKKTSPPTTSISAETATPVRKTISHSEPTDAKPASSAISASELRKQGLQMARTGIAAQVQRGDARKKYLNPNAMTTVESFYLNSWQDKVEQVGTLNFPEEARRLNVVTGPVLDVALRADGTVQAIRLVHSSGHDSLDRAARRIVELAAPFAPFPKELQRQYDILHIVRKWKFEQGRLLGR